MSLFLKAYAATTVDSYEALRSSVELRKATNLMVACISALEALRARCDFDPSKVGVVLSSVVGELGSSTVFLESLVKDSVARPLLFQNSLFHSTLGFLSIRYKWTGPTLTLGNRRETLRASFALAEDLIATGQCEECLILGAEESVSYYAPAYEKLSPPEGILKAGAGALLVSKSKEGSSIELSLKESVSSDANSNDFIESHELFRIATILQQDDKAGLENLCRELSFDVGFH